MPTKQQKQWEDALLDYTTAIDGVIDATQQAAELMVERTFAKREAIAGLVGSHNPQTGRAHSASSAEDALMDQPDYVDLWKRHKEAETNVAVARLTLELARARWQFAQMIARAQESSLALLDELEDEDLTQVNEGGVV